MSTETPNPQPDDKIRVTIEGRFSVRRPDGDDPYVTLATGYLVAQPSAAVVEVLERADDPSKDLVGTVRQEDHEGGYSLYQSVPVPSNPKWTRWMCTYSTVHGNFGCHLAHENVVGLPVIGVVPGTPAAEARDKANAACAPARPQVRVENAPGPSIPDRQRVADLLVSGDVVRAVRAAAAAGLTGEQAERYVRDMPEWQTYLNHHGHSTEVDPSEADRMRAMGFDRQPEFKLTDEQRAEFQSVLEERMGEYFRDSGHGHRLNTRDLSGVVADIVYAAIRQERLRAKDGA